MRQRLYTCSSRCCQSRTFVLPSLRGSTAHCHLLPAWLSAGLQVQALLLAPSSAEASPKGSPGPREASTDDLLDAAAVLIKSRELLEVLGGKLGAAAVPVCSRDCSAYEHMRPVHTAVSLLAGRPLFPSGSTALRAVSKSQQHACLCVPRAQFCPLGSKDDSTKPDVNTQMLLVETLGAVAALARPKLPKDAVAAIKARPHQLDLATDAKADPCADLSELRREEQQTVLGAAQAAADGVKAAEGQGPEALAAAKGVLADARAQVKAVVLDPRKRRRQLYQQVRLGLGLQQTNVRNTVQLSVCGVWRPRTAADLTTVLTALLFEV